MTFRSILESDARLSDRLRVAEQPGLLRTLAVFFAHSGDSWFWGLGLVLLWWQGDAFWKRWAVTLFACIAVLAITVLTIKLIVRRRRPEGEWGGIYRNTDPHSFPSGHAARSFLIAVFAIGLGPGWLAILLCIWAPLVSLARVAMGVHYLSDIVAGSILGIIIGMIGLPISPLLINWVTQTIPILLR